MVLFPVGDGNHSLATAKRCWEQLKSAGARPDHPARYALVELMNIHDQGLEFHPIYRLVESVDVEHLLRDLESFFSQEGCGLSFAPGQRLDSVDRPAAPPGSHQFEFVSRDKSGLFTVSGAKKVLEVATLDSWLNVYLQTHRGTEGPVMDYVHEAGTVIAKASETGDACGFLLPSMDKNDLVKTVVKEGALPRKTFSMGHAPEKRFYLECRSVVEQTR